VTAAIAFAIEIASSSPRSAIASALVENARICTASSTGSWNAGSDAGSRRRRDALLVEPEPRRRRRRDEDRDQELRQERPAEPALDHAQREHERDRAEPDAERRPVHRPALRHREPEADQEVVVRGPDRLQPEQVLHLVEHEQQARAGREARR
jgi:hypothetical protein